MTHGGGDADGPEFRMVGGVFVEAEEVRVGEEAGDVSWYTVLENELEELLEGCVG